MDWRDEGVLLSVRPHGEGAAILEAFTARHGRHLGVMPGGGSRRWKPLLQPGAQLDLAWRARLSEHVGSFRAEPVRSRAAALMADRAALAAIGAMAGLLRAFLPERAAAPGLYAVTQTTLDALGEDPDWPRVYAAWELALLAELGCRLDLSRCAATGATEGLAWVSPRTGRAVSAEAGAPWADRLIPLPGFLTGREGGTAAEALALTGFFLERWAAPQAGLAALPEPRARLAGLLATRGGASRA